MHSTERAVIMRFHARDAQNYRVDLDGAKIGNYTGDFTPPYDAATWTAISRALEPGFDLDEADAATCALTLRFSLGY